MEERRKNNSVRQFCIVTLFWLLAAGLSFVCSEIQVSEIRDTGESHTGSFLNGTLYSYNLINYIIGAVLFFVIFMLLWFFIMRGRFPKIRRCHIIGQVGCILITVCSPCGSFLIIHPRGEKGVRKLPLLLPGGFRARPAVCLWQAVFVPAAGQRY